VSGSSKRMLQMSTSCETSSSSVVLLLRNMSVNVTMDTAEEPDQVVSNQVKQMRRDATYVASLSCYGNKFGTLLLCIISGKFV
jgi:hypothetical protein